MTALTSGRAISLLREYFSLNLVFHNGDVTADAPSKRANHQQI
jgi:hypothetical protein